ncbi:MAG: type II secretion system F family protein [Halobacteriota archaeon]|nr:type II secretion system F family protein [Halobacteriota archaeon]
MEWVKSTDWIYSASYKIFGRSVRGHDLSELSLKLRRARIFLPADLYLSIIRMISSVVATFGGVVGVLAAYFYLTFPTNDSTILLTTLIGFACSIIFYILTMRACMAYPIFRADTRRMLIDRNLIHVVNYLYAMNKGGMSLINASKSLKKNEQVYGECAREIGFIVRDIEYFGLDMKSALEKSSRNTPSEKFKDMIEGFSSVLNTGGSIEDYLSLKYHQYQDLADNDNNAFLELLSIFAEAYVTLFVAGPLFLIVIIIVLGMLKSGTLMALSSIVYILIPVGASAFILLLDMITIRTDEEEPSFSKVNYLNVFESVEVVDDGSEGISSALKRYERIDRIKFLLHSPFRFFIEKPSRSVYITSIISMIYLFITVISTEEGLEYLDYSLFYVALLMIIPYSIFFELRAKRVRDIDKTVPEFLRRLKSINETGVDLIDCIRILIDSNLGVLTSELVTVIRLVEWGSTLKDAFRKLEIRVKTGALSRAITLLVEADRATGNLRDVLSIAASNAEATQRFKERREAAMSIYLIIVYITFAVFLFTIFILTTRFLGGLPKIPIEGAEEFLASDFDVRLYERVLFHGALLQGLFSGIVGGQMSSGNPYSGLKHAAVMMVGAFLVFEFMIWG